MLVNGIKKFWFSVQTITLVLIKFMASDKSDERQRVMFLPIGADWNGRWEKVQCDNMKATHHWAILLHLPLPALWSKAPHSARMYLQQELNKCSCWSSNYILPRFSFIVVSDSYFVQSRNHHISRTEEYYLLVRKLIFRRKQLPAGGIKRCWNDQDVTLVNSLILLHCLDRRLWCG
jgi:hypothetical protein